MRNLLLALAAVLAAPIIPAFPAQAQSSGAAFVGFPGGNPSVRVHHGFGRDQHRRGHRDRRLDDGAAIGFWSDGGEWALYNNRSWESDSYNDWWHDRPDRAFPRWLRNNQGCDRMWWGGGGWRC